MNEIQKKAIEYIIQTPKLLGFVIVSFLSGHLWYFIITTYIKVGRKGNTLLNNKIGKTTIGAFWNVLVLMAFYMITQKIITITWEQALEVVFATLLIGMVIQILIFAFFVKFIKET